MWKGGLVENLDLQGLVRGDLVGDFDPLSDGQTYCSSHNGAPFHLWVQEIDGQILEQSGRQVAPGRFVCSAFRMAYLFEVLKTLLLLLVGVQELRPRASPSHAWLGAPSCFTGSIPHVGRERGAIQPFPRARAGRVKLHSSESEMLYGAVSSARRLMPSKHLLIITISKASR